MKHRYWILFICFLFILNIMPAAAAAPSNDNFASAQTIVLNTKVKTLNIDEAVTEVGEADTCAAGVGTTPNHSVWYKFTAPFNGSLAISTAGSYVVLPT